MRTAMMYLLVLFALPGFGQKSPQWEVVKAIVLTNQTASTPLTTLLTPQSSVPYRIQAYLSTTAGGGNWTMNVNLIDMSGQTFSFPEFANSNNLWSSSGPFMIRPMPGTPITYSVNNNGSGGTYSFVISIEKLNDGN